MRIIGEYEEFGPGMGYPSIRGYIGDEPHPAKGKILQYLRNGHIHMVTASRVIDEESIEVVQKAEGDMLRRVSVAQLNALRDDAAALRRENGEAELSEEEWPVATEPEEWYVYADHAMQRICEAYVNGSILEYGEVMWY